MTVEQLIKNMSDIRERLEALRNLRGMDDAVAVAIGGDGIFIELADLREVLASEAERLESRLRKYRKAMDEARKAINKSLMEAQ